METDEKLRAGICVHFFNEASIKGKLQLSHYEFDSGIHYHTAYGLIGDESDPIYVVFAMPHKSDDIYLMITDGDPSLVAGQLAALQKYNEEAEHVCLYHTVPTKSDVFNTNDWIAFLTIRPCTIITTFKDDAEIGDRNFRFRLVIPINAEERKLKMESGIEALMDLFEETKRDVITFEQPEHNKGMQSDRQKATPFVGG